MKLRNFPHNKADYEAAERCGQTYEIKSYNPEDHRDSGADLPETGGSIT